ncbi:MAG: SGNH/GDSL hydrolase family protein, partial [Lachnospiraceae bacterium]|nr:SGNH/GDSL hydrolase family protein [Lachnospiraceae bacterium]
PNDWTNVSGEGEISFTINCANLGLIYYRTTDGKSGQFDIEVDGNVVATLDANFKGGWGNYAESTEVFSSDTAAEHKVVIRKNANSENEEFTILGLLVSGGQE